MSERVVFNIRNAVKTRVEGPFEAYRHLTSSLMIAHPKARFMRAVKLRRWDGMVRFFNSNTKTLDTGLVYRASKVLKKEGYECETVRPRIPRFQERQPQGLLDIDELRDYQIRAVDQLLRVLRLAIQCPTGSGKTEIGAEICRRTGYPTLWVVHSKDLLRQTAKRLRVLLQDEPIGVIGDGYFNVELNTVATVQSLSKIETPRFWEPWHALIIDEAQHTSAETWYWVASQCKNAHVRVGLSGTIKTGDPIRDMKLEGATGPRSVITKSKTLVDKGILARPRIVMLRPPAETYPTYQLVRDEICPEWRDNRRVLSKKGSELFTTAYIRGIVKNETRNKWISSIVAYHILRGDKVLVLCSRIPHGELLSRACGATFLHGKVDAAERERYLETFQEETNGACLVASTIFDEGVNIPEVDVLVLSGGGQSTIKTLQRLGRGLRRRPGKEEVVVYDFLDGADTEESKDYLAVHSARRLQDFRDEGYKVSVTETLDFSWLGTA